MSETGFLAANGGGCGADGALKPKADGVKMLKLFSARVVRPTIKSISWSGLTLTVRLNTRCHLLAFAAKVEKQLQATVSIQ